MPHVDLLSLAITGPARLNAMNENRVSIAQRVDRILAPNAASPQRLSLYE
ncbi:MAG TPA: hypothetical protein VJ875_16150 [Pyrinomonadaceae bacterium]|nr:hypothetical protein [Pyrinomonadaceae bacterium]